MLELVREEVKGCTDVPRLHAAAGVLCQLAGGTEPVRSGALRSALILLANRYPKVGGWASRLAKLPADLHGFWVALLTCSHEVDSFHLRFQSSPTALPFSCCLSASTQVRRYAAEQLYTMLLTFEPAEDGSQDVEAAMELVEGTAWDGPLAAVRPARAQVFRLLSLPEPAPVAAAEGAAAGQQGDGGQQQNGAPPVQDDNASYSALLTHTLRGM